MGRGNVTEEAVDLVLSNHRTKSPNTEGGHVSTPGVGEVVRGPQLLL